jgi:hypothetical protein
MRPTGCGAELGATRLEYDFFFFVRDHLRSPEDRSISRSAPANASLGNHVNGG